MKTRIASFLALAAVAACGGKEARAPVGSDDGRPMQVAKKPPLSPEGPVVGHLVASVGERTLGPFFTNNVVSSERAICVMWSTFNEWMIAECL